MRNFKLILSAFFLLSLLPASFNHLQARSEEHGNNKEGKQHSEHAGAATGGAHRHDSSSNHKGDRAAYNLGENRGSNGGANGAVIYSQPQNPTYVAPSNQMPQ